MRITRVRLVSRPVGEPGTPTDFDISDVELPELVGQV